jgi:hypothetical protein
MPVANFSRGCKQGCLGKVGSIRRASTKARMRAPAIVEIQVPAKPGARLGDAGIGVQIHLLILHRAPEPFDSKRCVLIPL